MNLTPQPPSVNYDIQYVEDTTDAVQNATCSCLQKFHSLLNRIFYKLGHFIALYPSYFIMVPVFLTLLGMTGVQQMEYIKDPEYLFSPTNGVGRHDRDKLEKLFPIDYSNHFDPSRITRISHFGRLLITSKDNGTVFRKEVWDSIIAFDSTIQNLTIEWEGDTYTYFDLCAKMNNKCIENKVFGLNDYMPEIENGSMTLNYPVMLFPLVLPFFFGGPIVNETEGVLLGARSIALSYWFDDNDYKKKERSHLFEGKILELLDTTDFEHLNIARFVSRSLEDELQKNADAIMPYLQLTVMFMVLFSIFSVFMMDWVRSKIGIGFVGVLSAGLSTGCAFGILMYCGVPFIGINMAAPFLMLGIGIDDMFVVLSAWQRTKIQDDVPRRMALTYSEAAVSITITSLTNMLSFFIGMFTPFPSVYIFCFYTGLSILLNYIWCITFFGGCLAIAGYNERDQKHSLSCRPVKARSQSAEEGCFYNFWCTGGINPEDPWNPKDNKTHVVMVFFRDYVGKAINLPIIKGIIICIFLVYLGGAIYGCLRVREGLERRRLALDDSYLTNFFDYEDEFYRKYPYRIQIIINQELTYSDPETEKKLMALHETFENLTYIGPKLYTESWIRGFYSYIQRRPHLQKQITDEKSFIAVLKREYLVPITPEYLDVVFNEDETKIVASRFIIQSYDIKDTNEDKDMMQTLREIGKESPFEIIVYHAFFVFFDQFLLVRVTSIQTISLAAVVMMIVSLIFIPNALCSLWVAFSIVSIEIGVIGYMTLWGVNLDSVAMINLIMCIGFSVDFSAHISYAYLTAKVNTPAERVRECLFTLGFPVLQGGLSTIVGVMVLVCAPSYIFLTFFKIVFLVIFFGIMHGLLLLPVMLSLFGPGSCTNYENDNGSMPRIVQNINEVVPHIVQTPSVVLKSGKEDLDSLDRDLGIGSSGSSSQSSLNEIGCTAENSDSEVSNCHSRRPSSEDGIGRKNQAFVDDDDDDICIERL